MSDIVSVERLIPAPPDKIFATAERHGLKTVANQTSFFWEVASLRRTTATPAS